MALGFTDVEFDALMAEMHRGFEEELREEEAALLALELEKTELRERARDARRLRAARALGLGGDARARAGTTPAERIS